MIRDRIRRIPWRAYPWYRLLLTQRGYLGKSYVPFYGFYHLVIRHKCPPGFPSCSVSRVGLLGARYIRPVSKNITSPTALFGGGGSKSYLITPFPRSYVGLNWSSRPLNQSPLTLILCGSPSAVTIIDAISNRRDDLPWLDCYHTAP